MQNLTFTFTLSLENANDEAQELLELLASMVGGLAESRAVKEDNKPLYAANLRAAAVEVEQQLLHLSGQIGASY